MLLNYTIMYKTGALLRPQHFSEFHKCWTNGVRKPGAAEGGQQGSPGSLQSRAAEWWLTGDKTHYSPSPAGRPVQHRGCGQGATGGSGHDKGHGPHVLC